MKQTSCGNDGCGDFNVLKNAVGKPQANDIGHMNNNANTIFLRPHKMCAFRGYTMATNLKRK